MNCQNKSVVISFAKVNKYEANNGNFNQMRYLIKKYPVLREHMWKVIKKEIDYIRRNKIKEEPLSL